MTIRRRTEATQTWQGIESRADAMHSAEMPHPSASSHFVRFHNTHAYPGCPVSLSDGFAAAAAGAQAEVEFTDGAMAHCLKLGGDGEPDRLAIRVTPYRTARGTEIGERDWLLARRGEAWKVARRLRPNGPGQG